MDSEALGHTFWTTSARPGSRKSICSTVTAFSRTTPSRAPGPTTTDELEKNPSKAQLYAERYAKMRSGIIPHDFDVQTDNVAVLGGLDFVFIAVDNNETRGWLLPTLSEMGIPFVDVGMESRGLMTSFSESFELASVRR